MKVVELTTRCLDRGLLWDIKNLLWGPSKEEEEEDEANRKAHSLRETGMQDEALRQAREQRDYQRKLAAERLESARDMENKTAAELNTIYSELNTSNYQLGEAKANLEKTKAEFQLLCNKEIELVCLNPSPASTSNIDILSG